MSMLVCRSPIDGKVLVERETMSRSEIAKAAAVARTAQAEWSRTQINDRAAAMLRFLDAMRDMNGDVTRELALQMGRPVQYGGEFRSLEERVLHMTDIAEAALAPVQPAPRPGFTRTIRREPDRKSVV